MAWDSTPAGPGESAHCLVAIQVRAWAGVCCREGSERLKRVERSSCGDVICRYFSYQPIILASYSCSNYAYRFPFLDEGRNRSELAGLLVACEIGIQIYGKRKGSHSFNFHQGYSTRGEHTPDILRQLARQFPSKQRRRHKAGRIKRIHELFHPEAVAKLHLARRQQHLNLLLSD